jgi:hypothetical protein
MIQMQQQSLIARNKVMHVSFARCSNLTKTGHVQLNKELLKQGLVCGAMEL